MAKRKAKSKEPAEDSPEDAGDRFDDFQDLELDPSDEVDSGPGLDPELDFAAHAASGDGYDPLDYDDDHVDADDFGFHEEDMPGDGKFHSDDDPDRTEIRPSYERMKAAYEAGGENPFAAAEDEESATDFAVLDDATTVASSAAGGGSAISASDRRVTDRAARSRSRSGGKRSAEDLAPGHDATDNLRRLATPQGRPLGEQLREARWWHWLGPVVAVLSILALIVGLNLSDDVDAQQLDRFLQQKQQKDFAGAAITLAELDAPEALHERLLADLSREKDLVVRRDARLAKTRFAQKKYGEALSLATVVAKLAPTSDIEFIVAESLRHMGRAGPAQSAYANFVSRYAKDSRVDDALFWQGESALSSGDANMARSLWQKLIDEYPGSDFLRSTRRRIEELPQ